MTQLYSSPIFGPVHSRRLGISLGINLLPADGKVCSFDCIYCECGFNRQHIAHQPFPTREQVAKTLEEKLQEMAAAATSPDVLTFAGNGEPTLHPHFAGIIDDTIRLRNRYFPQAKVSVLSNATRIQRPEVAEALLKVDNNILKLDTADTAYILAVDRPVGSYDKETVVEAMKRFKGQCVIQTIFLSGEYEGRNMDNTSDIYVLPWIATVKSIAPREVMIYTIDRDTPAQGLQKATHDQLDRIVTLLKKEGIKATASY